MRRVISLQRKYMHPHRVALHIDGQLVMTSIVNVEQRDVRHENDDVRWERYVCVPLLRTLDIYDHVRMAMRSVMMLVRYTVSGYSAWKNMCRPMSRVVTQ